jgi:trimethylamine:corrinoid methyltransferase-like protein
MRELSQPEFLDRRVREEWEERGASDLHSRCLAKAREVLADYQPVQLDDDVKRRLHAIVEKTDRLVGVA